MRKVTKSKTKSKSEMILPYLNIFADTPFFHFPNHILKLNARDQPKNAGKKVF